MLLRLAWLAADKAEQDAKRVPVFP
jgi:hypothetical protein